MTSYLQLAGVIVFLFAPVVYRLLYGVPNLSTEGGTLLVVLYLPALFLLFGVLHKALESVIRLALTVQYVIAVRKRHPVTTFGHQFVREVYEQSIDTCLLCDSEDVSGTVSVWSRGLVAFGLAFRELEGGMNEECNTCSYESELEPERTLEVV
jgi:hypothetical protein